MLEQNRYRRIIHVDLDAAFASIEQRDNPEIQGKPVAVGSTERRGVVATCSYEARKYGVRSAMPSYRALELCPQLIFVSPNFHKYKEANRILEQILLEVSEIVEIVSIDEAYVDITHNNINENNPDEVGKWIKQQVKSRIGITCSVGISYCKSIAKVSSGLNKPDGLTHIAEENLEQFLKNLPIGDFRGVGGKTKAFLEQNNIFTGQDLRDQSIQTLVEWFGEKRAVWLYNIVRGIDDREVMSQQEERKSINISQTYQTDITNGAATAAKIWDIAQQISLKVKRYKLEPRTITVKIKFNDFQLVTRSMTSGVAIIDDEMIYKLSMRLLSQRALGKPVRLYGIGLSNFIDQRFKLW